MACGVGLKYCGPYEEFLTHIHPMGLLYFKHVFIMQPCLGNLYTPHTFTVPALDFIAPSCQFIYPKCSIENFLGAKCFISYWGSFIECFNLTFLFQQKNKRKRKRSLNIGEVNALEYHEKVSLNMFQFKIKIFINSSHEV